jgi:hypothetical protein
MHVAYPDAQGGGASVGGVVWTQGQPAEVRSQRKRTGYEQGFQAVVEPDELVLAGVVLALLDGRRVLRPVMAVLAAPL